MVQIFKNEIESHLINPGNAERSLLILTSRFFWFFFFFSFHQRHEIFTFVKQLFYNITNVI